MDDLKKLQSLLCDAESRVDRKTKKIIEAQIEATKKENSELKKLEEECQKISNKIKQIEKKELAAKKAAEEEIIGYFHNVFLNWVADKFIAFYGGLPDSLLVRIYRLKPELWTYEWIVYPREEKNRYVLEVSNDEGCDYPRYSSFIIEKANLNKIIGPENYDEAELYLFGDVEFNEIMDELVKK